MTETPITELPEFIEVGTRIGWRTWTGAIATVTITGIDYAGGTPVRIWTDTDGQWFEATCFRTLAEALPADLHRV